MGGYKFHLSFSFIDWQVYKNYLTPVKLISHLWQHCWISEIGFFYKLWLIKIIIIFLASQRSFTSIRLIFNAKKEFKTIEEDKKKVSLLFISRHMKVIQDALLYNKIECYNKGVQRIPSLSVKGCTHSLKQSHYSKYKMFGKAPKKGWALLWRSDADYIMMHDVNIEGVHGWPRTMVFLEAEMQWSLLIPPDQLV